MNDAYFIPSYEIALRWYRRHGRARRRWWQVWLVLVLMAGPAWGDAVSQDIFVNGSAPFVGSNWSVTLAGDAFSFVSNLYGDVMGIMFGPSQSRPGDVISVRMSAGGGDLQGTTILGGTVYTTGAGYMSCFTHCGVMTLTFDGTVIAPPFSAGRTVTLDIPVSFKGVFQFWDTNAAFAVSDALLADAIAHLTLRLDDSVPTLPHWQYASITYALGSTALVATPEPGTLLLVGTGLIGIGWWRRRR